MEESGHNAFEDFGLFQVDGVSGPGNRFQAAGWYHPVHFAGYAGELFVFFTGHEQRRRSDLFKPVVERRLSAGTHSPEAVGQPTRVVAQALRPQTGADNRGQAFLAVPKRQ